MNMQATYFPNWSESQKAAELINSDQTSKCALILISDAHRNEKDQFQAFFDVIEKPFFGGFFPGLIADASRREQGFIVIPIDQDVYTSVVPFGITESEYDEMIDKMSERAGTEIQSVFYFVDAMGSGKPDSIAYLYNYFGIGVNYIGGGAGSLSFESFPCLFNQDGMYSNAALLGLTSLPLSIGVEHGWKPISEPMKVTKATGNMLEELEWKPAFEVYRELVEQHSGEKFTDDNFFDIAKSYPFGMVKIDSEMVIRDPIQIAGKHIHVVDEVPEGEYVSLMHGNMDSLLEGARAARDKSVEESAGKDQGRKPFRFSIDCISRSLFMGDEFDKELQIIAGDDTVFGALTIGEIANSGELFLEIYNKTAVVCNW
ncbi:FIST C domain-containing protein [Cyclonatronum proteinivorum]|uniref:FIST C domain-containing protein n=1 Tax=Cyclonatronum proteinivorum TaxID=1457365 RepID=A0A345ULA4_9BACT|nr:FIST C-terminal domain-containing protein [Cyclonatronum proteinivorum]AXJ01256.1 FIST C domain-containing protein [Cyclonatronum proteinivorum]